MSTVTAFKARQMARKHTAADDAVFDHIRKLCDQRIEDAARVFPHDRVQFTVPTFIFGLPLFQPDPIFFRLYQSLKDRGFEVYSTGKPLELYITWREKAHKSPSIVKATSGKPKSFRKLSQLRKQLRG